MAVLDEPDWDEETKSEFVADVAEFLAELTPAWLFQAKSLFWFTREEEQ